MILIKIIYPGKIMTNNKREVRKNRDFEFLNDGFLAIL